MNKIVFCFVLLFSSLAYNYSESVEFSGTDVTPAMLPQKIMERIPLGTSPDDFNVRLNEGGTLVLDGTDLVLGEPKYGESKFTFMALDTLELRKKARIITGGLTLVIFVNKLVSEDGEIVAFKKEWKNAMDGQKAGDPGQPGDTGGLISVHVIQKLDGIIHVDVSGQNANGKAGAAGARGVPGPRGEDASSSLYDCRKGGGNGGAGGRGIQGGQGGDGGAGGQGGIFELYNVGMVPIPDASYTFQGAAGIGGTGGSGGPGGPGGPGGDGGSGSGHCSGGSPGPAGASGPAGQTGGSGQTGGDGRAIVKSLKIEAVIQKAVSESQ